MNKKQIIEFFSDIMGDCNNICGFISNKSTSYMIDVLSNIEQTPITKVQFDQLLSLQHLKTVSDDFFRFYWLEIPKTHFYYIEEIDLEEEMDSICSIEQLKWGLNRVFKDALFVYGNIQMGYEMLCRLSREELDNIFSKHIFDTAQVRKRGNTLHFEEIEKEDRYLISEMACKTFDNLSNKEELIEMLVTSYKNARAKGVQHPSFRNLLDGKYFEKTKCEQLSLFPEYCFADVMDYNVDSESDLIAKSELLAKRFTEAHQKAIKNTELYLSLASDLDVYVATSMRTKDHFNHMHRFVKKYLNRTS